MFKKLVFWAHDTINKEYIIMFQKFLLITIIIAFNSISPQTKNILWYKQPAEYFEEAIPLGNGKTGAAVFGGVKLDKIYLNDATLWSGEPVDLSQKYNAAQYIPEIRKALENEDYRLAEKLNKSIQGKFSESYAPLGTLSIEYNNIDEYGNYRRELDLSKAVSKVIFDCDGVIYTREYFVSNPDKVMIIKHTASKKKHLSFTVKFSSLLKYSVTADGCILKAEGYAPYHAEPHYRGNIPDPVRFDKERGTRFSTYIKVKNKGGNVVVTDSTIIVEDADEAAVYISAATSFNGFDKDPAKNGLNNKTLAAKQLTEAFALSDKELLKRHLLDYQKLFNRVELKLEEKKAPDLPTDERLKRYSEGAEDKNLEALYMQFGRYLMIASSRSEGVPSNLQGIWNPYLQPPWSSNYTMNINTEENYWLAEIANLSELHKPFLSFISNLSKTGQVTAEDFYGVDKGWASCHNSDIWAMSNPVGGFGDGDPMWACWNMSGAWSVTHLWEHYIFNGDKKYLSDYAYPLMKGAAEFCLGWLVKDKQGYLVTSPSTSPENSYITPDGFKGATLYGSTSDLAMIRECFNQTIEASKQLKIDDAFCDSLQQALKQLYPYQVGKKGSLQEWYYDWDDAEPTHRHQSHLYGLYPGHQITPDKTPQLADACRKTLLIRGDETTGWSMGWRINLWARLRDGNHAYKLLRKLLSYVEPDGKNANPAHKGGTYPNLFDAHPPFQIDGNFGGAAGIIEMLLQSDEDGVYLLPALPDAWQSGSVKGICARGGFEISIQWKNGNIEGVRVLSKTGKECCLFYKDKKIKFNTIKGKLYSLDENLKLNSK